MKIVIAVDSFKGSVGTIRAADCLERGILRAVPAARVVKIPVADGGEGTVAAILGSIGGRLIECEVTGPLGNKCTADFGILDNGTAVIETAAASGLTLIPPEKRNPLIATSYGLGQLILAAMDAGCRSIIIGLGGSATNDGGSGTAKALGVRFLDMDSRELPQGGEALSRLAVIDISGLDPRIAECNITLASDVSNPLCGKSGASAVYGPQKGATEEMVQVLDAALNRYGRIIHAQLHRDIADIPGAGAAGGLGAGLMAFCNARLQSGINTVLQIAGFEEALDGADLVITGEGRIDGSSAYGKAPVGVAQLALKHNIPVIAITGNVGPGASGVYQAGIGAILPIADRPLSLAESMAEAPELLEEAGERLMRLLMIGRDMVLRKCALTCAGAGHEARGSGIGAGL